MTIKQTMEKNICAFIFPRIYFLLCILQGLKASFKFWNPQLTGHKRISMNIKYLIIFIFFTASTLCQKCKKPKVPFRGHWNRIKQPIFRAMLEIQSRTRTHLATKESALLLARGLQRGLNILICNLSLSSVKISK